MKRQSPVSEETAENLLKASDKDGDNALNKDEFVKFNDSMEIVTGFDQGDKDIDELFAEIDADGDGSITSEEMAAHREDMIKELEEKFSGEQTATMDQVNSILSQTQQTLLDMMDSNTDDNDEDNSFSFLSSEWSAQIQEYLAQQEVTKGDETGSIQSILNSAGISQIV